MRRRLLILLVVLTVVGGAAFAYVWPIINQAPTCTDNTQNGDELGVDCGGSCVNFCSNQINMPTILWSRAFPVTTNVYNAMAYIENKNDAAVQAMPYEFRMYDVHDILVARASGVATIPPLGRYAIVETGIQTGTASIVRTTFLFAKNSPTWQRVPAEIESLRILTSDLRMNTLGVVPKLTATLTNNSVSKTIVNTTVAAVLYDVNDNAINVSKTVIPRISPNTSIPVFFTWPHLPTDAVTRTELIPVIDVFNTR